jgi:serine phosphatase RsbU (regulator of sigma subunit)
MAQLRTGIRSYMLEGHGPAATLLRLNRLLLRFHPDVTATACVAIFDRPSGRVVLANAGHPPPLLRTAAGVSYLPVGGPLLGVEGDAPGELAFAIGKNDVLLLFTDGLVERRGETIADGLTRLSGSVAEAEDNVDALCDRRLRDVGPTSQTDDIALVAIRPTR